jgi:hypothetical protein
MERARARPCTCAPRAHWGAKFWATYARSGRSRSGQPSSWPSSTTAMRSVLMLASGPQLSRSRRLQLYFGSLLLCLRCPSSDLGGDGHEREAICHSFAHPLRISRPRRTMEAQRRRKIRVPASTNSKMSRTQARHCQENFWAPGPARATRAGDLGNVKSSKVACITCG